MTTKQQQIALQQLRQLELQGEDRYIRVRVLAEAYAQQLTELAGIAGNISAYAQLLQLYEEEQS